MRKSVNTNGAANLEGVRPRYIQAEIGRAPFQAQEAEIHKRVYSHHFHRDQFTARIGSILISVQIFAFWKYDLQICIVGACYVLGRRKEAAWQDARRA